MHFTIIAEDAGRAVEKIRSALPNTALREQSGTPNVKKLELETSADEVALEAKVKELADTFDVFFYDKKPGLVVFDMDSTLIKNECIDLIAKRAGVEPQVAEITERAMRGELDFQQSLQERVGLLKGIDSRTIYSDLVKEIEITPGARELCAGLRSHGIKTAVLSGGFQPIVDWIKGELGLDYAFANHLVADKESGLLTGHTTGAIVDGQRKAELLTQIAAENEIPLNAVVAVGDGSNDLPMMAKAGYGIAWHAKPLVRARAPSQLNSESLADILYVFGLA